MRVGASERGKVSGGGRGGKDEKKEFLEPQIYLFNKTPHLGGRLT